MERREDLREHEELTAPVAPDPVAPLSGTQQVLALQRSAGNQAVARTIATKPSDAFDLATSGAGSEVPRRREMESAFGTSFKDVRAHLGGAAATDGLGLMRARAATRGQDVVFGEASPPPDLVAHELAHVVQQRRAASAGIALSAQDAPNSSPAERAAERAGEAVAAGRPVGDVGIADTGAIQLAPVKTAGGEWDTEDYAANDGPGTIGAHMRLKFTPKDPVVADQIGLTQTVKTLKKTGASAAQPNFVGQRNQDLSLPTGSKDPGRAVDQGDGAIPNTNPLYAVENSPGKISATLGDQPANPGFGVHAKRKLNADGKTYDEVAGILDDTPTRGKVPGEGWDQKFEVTAIPLDGPLKNMYLGSVEWGWKRTADVVSLDPAAIRVVREGTPTAAFMEAAERWNAATFSQDGTDYATVDLPIESVDVGALTKTQLTQRLWKVRTDADKALPADKPRKEFEIKVLERELAKRK